jgi:hypothetical protein
MARRTTSNGQPSLEPDQREVERYQAAAKLALEQLEWCISYLHGIRRSGIARALQRNRKTIIERHRL